MVTLNVDTPYLACEICHLRSKPLGKEVISNPSTDSEPGQREQYNMMKDTSCFFIHSWVEQSFESALLLSHQFREFWRDNVCTSAVLHQLAWIETNSRDGEISLADSSAAQLRP
ncbi:hypothetical protein RRG08_007982 [Elysia crispata]|uniref:Uncharacterized protein n=1 Tax=Elysia crispata TaxID=231223 RepID=A0AAE0ZHN4_9GAST|nr:hypothetical protein RRG08_007982 [Elysia crispata]